MSEVQGSIGRRLRQALVSNPGAPKVWLTAVCAVLGIGIASGIALAFGLRDVSLAAGYVAALAGVAGTLVPPGLTRQVAVPTGLAVAVAPPLALAGEGRPVVAAVVAAVVFTLGTLVQQDVPTGRLAGALGSTAYVLAVGMGVVRDVSLSHAFWAAVIGLATAVLTTTAARALRAWMVRRGRATAAPQVPRLPGHVVSRLVASTRGALRDWRHNVYVRLALRRLVVLAPLVGVVETGRDPVALYALIVSFSVTQPTASDTLNRALARTAGTIGAVAVTGVLAVVAPDWVVMVFAAFAMVAGLAYVLRSPFLTSLGTTVLTAATSAVAGTSTGVVNRIVSTVIGALVGLLATVVIPVPGPTRAPDTTTAPEVA